MVKDGVQICLHVVTLRTIGGDTNSQEWPLETKGTGEVPLPEPAALVPAESTETPHNTSGEAVAPSSAVVPAGQIPAAILSPTAPPPPTPIPSTMAVPLVSDTAVRPQFEQSPAPVVGQEEEEFCDV
eukprot:NODE_20610_length_790_cov_5.276018.p2 GENE.NODE_20610_length_790_cov_5.276018~~NODE_20610_length_790_cov_5.276018.p2  ORF type:complete len:127 (-),score=17.02 NODE_20610_length_790_cov_5.276018:207-587(-)